MSLEEPVIVSVVSVEETAFVIDVVTPPIVPAIDVTVDPATAIVVDISSSPVDVIFGVEVTSFVVDVVTPVPLSAIDVTVGDPAATIIVDIPGSSSDEVIGGKITIASTAPSSPSVNDVWIDTS